MNIYKKWQHNHEVIATSWRCLKYNSIKIDTESENVNTAQDADFVKPLKIDCFVALEISRERKKLQKFCRHVPGVKLQTESLRNNGFAWTG